MIMSRIDAVWEAIGQLTYAEMIEFSTALHDMAESLETTGDGVEGWASVIEAARSEHVTGEA